MQANRTEFRVGDRIVVCTGEWVGKQCVVRRITPYYLWVAGLIAGLCKVRKTSVALVLEGASSESEADNSTPHLIPDDDSTL